jgi:hypothetical protein
MNAQDPFLRRYLDAMLAGVERARRALPGIARAAGPVAERLLAGGDLYIAGVRPDFVSEGYIRSGGLMLLREYRPAAGLSEKDSVLLGWSGAAADQDLALLRELGRTGARVVGIGPPPPETISDGFLPMLDAFLESDPPAPAEVTDRFGGEAYPLVSLQNLVLLWAFTAELVAACARRGAMPAMYQSVLTPGARERNALYRDRPFHEAHGVPPLPSGRMGGAYLERIGECLSALRDRESGSLEAVARACAEAIRSGHRVHAFLIGHFPVHQAGAPGDPGLFGRIEAVSGETPSIDALERNLKPGDLFFFLGYYRRPREAYETVRRLGGRIVEVITGTDAPETGEPRPDLVIRPCWPYTDALVEVPGYDVRILPASGIVQTAVYWSVVGAMSG